MIYVLLIPVVAVLILLVWVVARMMQARQEQDRPFSAQNTPVAPAAEEADHTEVRP